jgi:uncharacterized protein (TIGR02466 family)
MVSIDTLFATRLYRAELARREVAKLNPELLAAAQLLATQDRAGRAWCARNGYPGYTSYASLNDLPWRFPVFAALEKPILRHANAFAKALEWDLAGRALELDSIWVNILPPGGVHTSHIHPHSVISGTYYAAVPPGASALKLEDPRLALMMAAPARRAKASAENRPFVYVSPAVGTLLLWESWLRHEVPLNEAEDDRISVSFNIRWA